MTRNTAAPGLWLDDVTHVLVSFVEPAGCFLVAFFSRGVGLVEIYGKIPTAPLEKVGDTTGK